MPGPVSYTHLSSSTVICAISGSNSRMSSKLPSMYIGTLLFIKCSVSYTHLLDKPVSHLLYYWLHNRFEQTLLVTKTSVNRTCASHGVFCRRSQRRVFVSIEQKLFFSAFLKPARSITFVETPKLDSVAWQMSVSTAAAGQAYRAERDKKKLPAFSCLFLIVCLLYTSRCV